MIMKPLSIKKIITISFLGVIATIICWRIVCYYNPSSVFIALPNDYRGKLTIKEDANKGHMLDGKALENFGHYVYEFYVIKDRAVFVENIAFLLNAKSIEASGISVFPLESEIILKNKKERYVVLKISDPRKSGPDYRGGLLPEKTDDSEFHSSIKRMVK